MKILVITGSPHLDGTSSYLATQFIAGAEQKGHQVHRVDAASLNIEGCLGCNYCRNHNDVCIQKDAMKDVMPYVLQADLIAFTTPVYLMGISAQLKTILDRFYVNFLTLRQMKKKWILMVTCNDQTDTVIAPTKVFFDILMNHCGWEEVKSIYAQGYNTKEDIKDSIYAKEAYELGFQI